MTNSANSPKKIAQTFVQQYIEGVKDRIDIDRDLRTPSQDYPIALTPIH
ncbi:hypothetical protein QT971_19270 [Microcoleus sp. herbarium19]